MTIIGCLKVFGLNVVWMTVCLFGAVVTTIEAMITNNWLDLKHTRTIAHTIVERKCGMLVTLLFIGPVVIRGLEHLPPDQGGVIPAPVYIANHASQIDVAVVYYLERSWRWIAKSSTKFLPGVGQIILLGKSFSNRKNILVTMINSCNGSKSESYESFWNVIFR